MRKLFGLGIWLGVVLAPCAAAAAPVDYDCDTPVGSYSELAQIQAGPAYHVRGTITALQFRDDNRWLAGGQIRLENGDETRSVAVRVVRVERTARARFDLVVQNGGEPQPTTLGEVGLNEAVPFELQVLASGDAVAVVGGQRRSFRLDLGRNAKVKAICSTGEYLFSGLDFGG